MYVFPPKPELPFARQASDLQPAEVGYAYRDYNSRIRVPIYGPQVLHPPHATMTVLHLHYQLEYGSGNSAVALLQRDPVQRFPMHYLTTPRHGDERHKPILHAAVPFAQAHTLATWDTERLRYNLDFCGDFELANELRRHPIFCIRSALEALGVDAVTPLQACMMLKMTPASVGDHLATTLMLGHLLDLVCCPEQFPEYFPRYASPQPARSPRKARKTATRKAGG